MRRPPATSASSFVIAAALLMVAPSPSRAAWNCPEATATEADCGHATCTEEDIRTADALLALKSAVGSAYCALCRCDVDASGLTTAGDAARILRSAVGQQADLTCPACNSLTLELLEEPPAEAARASSTGGDAGEQAEGPAPKSYEFWTAVSTTLLEDGRTAIIGRNKFLPSRTHLVLKDAGGEVLSTAILFENVYTDGRIDCAAGSANCLLSRRIWLPGQHTLRLAVLDVDAPETMDLVLVKEVVEEGEGDIEISTGAGAYTFACDAGGICVVGWALHRTTIEDQDYEDTEALGFYARAIHVRTGEAGPEFFLDTVSPDDTWTHPQVAALGDNRFRITVGVTVREFEVR